jgi:selenocysteine lyase/cysteine desulfurase
MTELKLNIAEAPYDVARVRADFPILSREVYGKPLVYLDNGASAQKPRAVIDAMRHVMVARGLWQAACLSRQWRFRAEAARRHRRHAARDGA